MPGRAINNDFIARVQKGEVHNHCRVNCLQRCDLRDNKIGYCIIGALSLTRAGNMKDGLIFCGSNAYRSAEQGIVPVARIVNELTGRKRI